MVKNNPGIIDELEEIRGQLVDNVDALSIFTQGFIHSKSIEKAEEILREVRKSYTQKRKKKLIRKIKEYGNNLEKYVSQDSRLKQKINPKSLSFLSSKGISGWLDLFNSTDYAVSSVASGTASDFLERYKKAVDNLDETIDSLRKPENETASLKKEIEDLFPGLEEKHLEYIIENDMLIKLTGGFSSGIVLSSLESVAKQDSKEANEYISKIYYGLDLGEFEEFRPKFKRVVELANSSLLIMENTFSKEPAYLKTVLRGKENRNLTKKDYINHNLYLMGLLHKEATRAVKRAEKENKDLQIKENIYKTLDGKPHYEAIKEPLENTSNRVYKEFKDVPDELVKQIIPIIDNTLAYLKSGEQSIIDGDWKGNGMNCPNGYKVDPLFCYGKEIVDIANFLSEPALKLSQAQMELYLNDYINIRSVHDAAFREDIAKQKEMYAWFDNVRLKELSVYLSCTRKRPLQETYYMNRRKILTQEIQSLVRNRTFA